MGRTATALEKQKLSKKRNRVKKQKQLKETLRNERRENEQMKRELYIAKARMHTIAPKYDPTSATKHMYAKSSKQFKKLLPKCSILSTDVVKEANETIGEGTFGKVLKGWYKPLDIACAIKVGKHNYFDAKFEAMVLQKLQSSPYFPRVFGVYEEKLVMEYVSFESKPSTVLSELENIDISVQSWISLCSQLCDAVKFMHVAGLLHNDIKANNVLLKKMNDIIPILIDVGKVRSRYYPDVYKLSESQKVRYNKKYPHLAYELRNEYGAKQSVATDVFSLGYLFETISNTKIAFLRALSRQMLQENPAKRINLVQVWKSFQQKI